MSYIPPITMDVFYENTTDKIAKELTNKQDHFIYEQVMAVSNIKIDEDEFKRALKYDRGQYDCGYRDGYYARDNEITRCKDCKYFTPQPDTIEACCDLTYSRALPDDYCSYGKRRETE